MTEQRSRKGKRPARIKVQTGQYQDAKLQV
jgi:hypothetical protein